MLSSTRVTRRPKSLLLAGLVAVAALLVVAPAASAKVKIGVQGWTSQPTSLDPQAKNGKTIEECLDVGDGQRSIYAIIRGKGIKKGTKVGVGIWGGPSSGFDTVEPTDAEVKKSAFKWPADTKKAYVFQYGYSYAKGPFGPQNTNGEWKAKVLVNGKKKASGKVTVAC